jgi:hypothetical protein
MYRPVIVFSSGSHIMQHTWRQSRMGRARYGTGCAVAVILHQWKRNHETWKQSLMRKKRRMPGSRGAFGLLTDGTFYEFKILAFTLRAGDAEHFEHFCHRLRCVEGESLVLCAIGDSFVSCVTLWRCVLSIITFKQRRVSIPPRLLTTKL